ncbi:sporulation protein YunB [Thermosyntropha sp.]|uniref:sporulation protein YunB n=1 Tax=Thermosyntropha sp. TaxID=2740820 RepID=UPI0025E9BCED|nr:sporulation protein YunB [Thermosyntropha sp.]MBO8159397.1 sporulation protein YunB [Thermosyntropha sp.]
MINIRTRRHGKGSIFIFSLFIIILLFVYIDLRIQASLLEIAKSEAQIKGIERINKIVNEKVVSKVEYTDIVIVHKDDKGHIVLLQPNTIMLNKIMTGTVVEITKSLDNVQEEYIAIPLGQLSGLKVLAAAGPKLNVHIIPTGQINVEVLNKFEQAGINQTRHLIYFQINHTLKIAVPFMNEEIKVSSTIPLAETIIVGDVPKTYVDFKGENQSLYPFIKD